MTGTQYDHLLDRENVIAVWVADDGTVHVVVSAKLPEEDLADEDIISHAVGDDSPTDVHDAHLTPGADAFEPLVADPNDMEAMGDRHNRHRPVVAGVSEIHTDSTAATGGPYPARVTDTSKGRWADGMVEGILVRLSNAHVYAMSGQADMGDHILQPSPMDGGEDNRDAVGGLLGYAPLTEGVTADVAARGVDDAQASTGYHDLPEDWPTGVRRDNLAALAGERVTKTGRTTGVTETEVRGAGASVRVRYPGGIGVITLRDQLITGAFSRGGDSGSPVCTTDGELVGLVFAGSSTLTAVSPVANIESELGVELMTDTQDHEPERTFEDYMESELIESFGEENVERQYRTETERRIDLLANDPNNPHQWALELENDATSALNGTGQARHYAKRITKERPENGTGIPVLCVPEDHIDQDEKQDYKEDGIVIWEIPIPEDVSVGGV